MVRSFATSAGVLRAKTRQKGGRAEATETSGFALATPVLDAMVPALVVIFLLVAALSALVQFTSSRQDQLEASERALAGAARLVASEIGRTLAADGAQTTLSALPSEAVQAGRYFFLLNSLGIVTASTHASQALGMSALTLFADVGLNAADLSSPGLSRRRLANGQHATVATQKLSNSDLTLIAYESVDDELRQWRQHALIIGAVLLCFGAVTIAFTLTYYAQRSRARMIGSFAEKMQSRIAVALEHGHCAVWDWPLNAETVIWSGSMHRLIGRHAHGRLKVSDIRPRFHPEDGDVFALARAHAQAGEREFDHLFRMQHQNEEWIWLRMRAVILDGEGSTAKRLIGIVMDVTEERASEDLRRKSDGRLRDAIESISEAFVLWDENNRLLMCNSKYKAFHGLTAEQVQEGVRYSTLMAQASQPRLSVEIDCSQEQDSVERRYEAQFQDGRWLLINERPTRNGGYVSVGTDITARKQQESQLLDNERRLRMTIADLGASREAFRRQALELSELADRYREQKIEAVGAVRAKAEFLSNMNHEIRTPLNHIIGFSEIIEREVFGAVGEERYLEYARDIRLSGAALLDLINDILEMAEIEAGRVALERENIALGSLLESAVLGVTRDAEAKRIDIEIDPTSFVDAGQRRLYVDANAMSQALSHLIRNAIRLSPIGGRVSVRARHSGDHLNIFIADSGCSLKASDMQTLADPFGHIDGMLHNGCKGSGLGGAVAKALVELHGGTVRMRSAPNVGSLTLVRLPD